MMSTGVGFAAALAAIIGFLGLMSCGDSRNWQNVWGTLMLGGMLAYLFAAVVTAAP